MLNCSRMCSSMSSEHYVYAIVSCGDHSINKMPLCAVFFFWVPWLWIRLLITLIARFMGPTWGPSGADRTQMGPMLAPWTLLCGYLSVQWWNVFLSGKLPFVYDIIIFLFSMYGTYSKYLNCDWNHCSLVMPYGVRKNVNIGSSCG